MKLIGTALKIYIATGPKLKESENERNEGNKERNRAEDKMKINERKEYYIKMKKR